MTLHGIGVIFLICAIVNSIYEGHLKDAAQRRQAEWDAADRKRAEQRNPHNVACPTCGAPPHELCTGYLGPHKERFDAITAQLRASAIASADCSPSPSLTASRRSPQPRG